MTRRNSLRFALLAATALAATAPAVVHAAPATLEAVAPVEHAADEAQVSAPSKTARNLGIAAIAAALVSLIGGRRIGNLLKRAAPAAASAARAVAAAPIVAAKAVGRAAASPVRFAVIFGSLGFFALAGVGLYDVEWAGGLVAGALIATLLFGGAGRARRAFAKARRPRSDKFNQ